MKRNYTIITSASALIVVIFALLTGFHTESSAPEWVAETGITHTEPVDITFSDIKNRGSIRLITRYGAHSYFIHRGMDRGFEYDFFYSFARRNGLRVEVVIISPEDNPIDVLNRGDGDVIAANFTITEERQRYIAFSNPYNVVDQILVIPSHAYQEGQTLTDFDGLSISVRRNTSYLATLQKLKKEGYGFTIDIVPDDLDTETLIAGVAEGRFQATVADHNLFQAASLFIDGVAEGAILSEGNHVAWGVRNNDPALLEAANAFLTANFRIGEDGRPRRSAELNILTRRYFEDDTSVRNFRNPQYDFYHTGMISPYDDIVRPLADSAGIDWRLVIAVMAQESNFDPNARSWMGAVGLMQIMPRFSLIRDEAQLYDPETNIREGIRFLRKNLNRFAYLEGDLQIKMALATYNAGIGHVSDARRLTIDRNRDPNNWEDVASSLLLLMNRRYYQHARYGYVRGIETVNYVDRVMYRYQKYQNIDLLASGNRFVSQVLLP